MILKNWKHYQRTKDLEETVNVYKEYKTAKQNIEEAKTLIKRSWVKRNGTIDGKYF